MDVEQGGLSGYGTRVERIIAEYAVDRAGWQAGPWDGEGDCDIFMTDAGSPAAMYRNILGEWCGYVAVPASHPYAGMDIEDVCDIRVHGGLTFAGAGSYRLPDVPGVWWFGFDCGHAGDLLPYWTRPDLPELFQAVGVYRTAAYVRAELDDVAWQLATVPPPLDAVPAVGLAGAGEEGHA